MTITEENAIEAVRKFNLERKREPFDETQVEVRSAVIEHRETWVITAYDPAPTGPSAWMEPTWAPIRYFVDRKTGEMFGFATERSQTIFR